MRFVYVVGARPNFVKMAPVLAAMQRRFPADDHLLVHTGQHYDRAMSELFLDELGLPAPAHQLGVGSGTHAYQTGRVMEGLERVFVGDRPNLVFVPGDVNSTLATALVCTKMGIPYAHVESGLRSFDRSMPEEVNRIVADQFAQLLFAHSDEATENLEREGIAPERVHVVGNTMIDTLVRLEPRIRGLHAARTHNVTHGSYLLVTLHRPSLVDGPLLVNVLQELAALTGVMDVVFPVHPRTRQHIDEAAFPQIRFTDPVGYVEFLSLQVDAMAVLTDSGGVQEETTYLGVPCFTLRSTTERPVTLRVGTNTLLGLDPTAIRSIPERIEGRVHQPSRPPLWDGRAAERLAGVVADEASSGLLLA